MKKLVIILFMIPLFGLGQNNVNIYTFKLANINTEIELKRNKLVLQELLGISDDMQFSNGNIILKTTENYSIIELKFKLNSNNFPVIGDVYKNIKKEESTE